MDQMNNSRAIVTALLFTLSATGATALNAAQNDVAVATANGELQSNRSVEELVAIAKAGESNEAINDAVLGNEALGNEAINPNANNANSVNNNDITGVNNNQLSDTTPVRSNITLIDDQVGILNPQQKLRLEKQLQNIYFEGLANIALVIVPTTDGVPIFDYSLEIAEREGLGDKDIDDGLLILVAVSDRKIYIQTGYGLEGVLPDSALNRIIDEDITPYFKQNDYGAGLIAGDKIEQRLTADPDILAQADAQAEARSAQQGSEELPSPIFLFVMAMIFGSFITNIFGRVFGSILTAGGFFAGSLALGGGFFMTVIMAIFLWLFLISRGSGGGRGGRGGGGGGMVFLPGLGGGSGGGFGGGWFWWWRLRRWRRRFRWWRCWRLLVT